MYGCVQFFNKFIHQYVSKIIIISITAPEFSIVYNSILARTPRNNVKILSLFSPVLTEIFMKPQLMFLHCRDEYE